MTRSLLVGAGAGLAAALLMASLLTGTAFALPLFLLSSLPIAIAGLGFGPVAAGVGAVAAGAAVGIAASPTIGAAAFLLVTAPAAWLSVLLNLSWTVAGDERRFWFPLGRALLYGAAFISVALILIGLLVGFDPEALAAQSAALFAEWFTTAPEAGVSLTPSDIDALTRLNLALLPYSTAALALVMLVFNTWLGARVAAMSGQLARELQPLWTAELPLAAAGVFLSAMLLSLAGPPLGPAAAAVAGAFGMAHGLIGLAVLHALSRGMPGRPAILAIAYLLLVALRPTLFVFVLLGVADAFMRFRSRGAQSRT